MTFNDILKHFIDSDTTMVVQFLPECCSNVVLVGRKKDAPAHSRVTFVTQHLQPGDILYPEQAEKIGVVLWLPRAEYDRLASQ